MRTSISLLNTQTLVFSKSPKAPTRSGHWIGAGRYLGLAAIGVSLAVASYVALAAISADTRFQVLAALAAGLGLVQVWQGFDSGRLGLALSGIGAGVAVIWLAIAAAPSSASLLAGAFAIVAISTAAFHNRETGLWVPSATLSLTLALLSLA